MREVRVEDLRGRISCDSECALVLLDLSDLSDHRLMDGGPNLFLGGCVFDMVVEASCRIVIINETDMVDRCNLVTNGVGK